MRFGIVQALWLGAVAGALQQRRPQHHERCILAAWRGVSWRSAHCRSARQGVACCTGAPSVHKRAHRVTIEPSLMSCSAL